MQKRYASALNFTRAIHKNFGKYIAKHSKLLFPRVILETLLKFITD